MKLFESINDSSDSIVDYSKTLAEKSYKYYKLKAFRVTTASISITIRLLLVGLFSCFAMIFLAVSLSIFLGEVFHSVPLGYLAVGMLFMIIAFIFYKMKNWIDRKVLKTAAKKITL